MTKNPQIKTLIATVKGKKYKLVPSATCDGCAFDDKCNHGTTIEPSSLYSPEFNDYCICSQIDVIYKEIKE